MLKHVSQSRVQIDKSHNIIQLNDHVGWGWAYVMYGAGHMSCKVLELYFTIFLSISEFNLRNE